MCDRNTRLIKTDLRPVAARMMQNKSRKIRHQNFFYIEINYSYYMLEAESSRSGNRGQLKQNWI